MLEEMLDKFREERKAFLKNKEAETKKKEEEAAQRLMNELLEESRKNEYNLSVSLNADRINDLLMGANFTIVLKILEKRGIIREICGSVVNFQIPGE